jgi:predicted GNAT family acetyltransferase
MKEEYKELELIDNTSEQRFEMSVDDELAFIEYQKSNDTVKLIHTEVSPLLEGKGAATAIIEKTLFHLEANHFKLIALCPFVVAYLKRHPEWQRLL